MNKAKSLLLTTFGVAYLFLSCSKGGSSAPGNSGYGGTSGPPNTWLSNIFTIKGGDSLWTEITVGSSQLVQKVIVIRIGTGGSVGDTTYSTILPVYASGHLSELDTAADSLSTSGPGITFFDYTASGVLQRIRYYPGTPAYAYDSLVVGAGNLLTQSYHFVTKTSTGNTTLLYSETFTWNQNKDITSVLLSNVDTTTGAVSDMTITYTYDGLFNPYKTVRDLAYILGPLDSDLPMISANNPTNVQIIGFNASNAFQYQYNSKNLPSSQLIQTIQQGSVKSSNTVYFSYNQ